MTLPEASQYTNQSTRTENIPQKDYDFSTLRIPSHFLYQACLAGLQLARRQDLPHYTLET